MFVAFSDKPLRAPFPSFPPNETCPRENREPESSSFNSFCSFVCVGLAFLLTLLSCSFARPNPFLEGPKLKGFEQAGPLTVYNRTNLFDYMNGEAEAYFPFGFRLLYVSIFRDEKTDTRMVLEIYDMSTPEGAGDILKTYSSEGGSTLPGIGDAAWADKGILLFRQSGHFVRIFPDPSPENEVRPTEQEMLALARAIGGLLR